MFQNIELETYAGQTKTIKLDKVLSGFPIDVENLKGIIWNNNLSSLFLLFIIISSYK